MPDSTRSPTLTVTALVRQKFGSLWPTSCQSSVSKMVIRRAGAGASAAAAKSQRAKSGAARSLAIVPI
jgi:hypothetical protein